MDPNNAVKDVKIHNEGNVDRAYILKEATDLYNECLRLATEEKIDIKRVKSGKGKIKKQDTIFLDNLHDTMRKVHKQLSDTYPTVVRHMIQELQYSATAFDMYLKTVEKSPWMNDEQRMDSYTEYAVILYKENNKGKHMSKTQVELFRKDYRKRLQEEHDKFMENIEEYQKQIDREEKKYDLGRRQDLINLLKKQIQEEDKKVRENIDSSAVAVGADTLTVAGAGAPSSPAPAESSREQIERLVKAGILSPDALTDE